MDFIMFVGGYVVAAVVALALCLMGFTMDKHLQD